MATVEVVVVSLGPLMRLGLDELCAGLEVEVVPLVAVALGAVVVVSTLVWLFRTGLLLLLASSRLLIAALFSRSSSSSSSRADFSFLHPAV